LHFTRLAGQTRPEVNGRKISSANGRPPNLLHEARRVKVPDTTTQLNMLSRHDVREIVDKELEETKVHIFETC
jgi:hypothetical protein